MEPDEITLQQTLAISSSLTADTSLGQKIDDAVALEMTKTTKRFDTLRAITPANPMEHDA